MWLYVAMISIIALTVVFKAVTISHSQARSEKKEVGRTFSSETFWWSIAIGGSVVLLAAGAWFVLAEVFTSIWLWPVGVTVLAISIILWLDPPENKKTVAKKWVKTIAVLSIVACCLYVLSEGSLDKAERWLLERSQAKAIAEAKAKEVVWEGEQIIVAPTTTDWEKMAEFKLPSYFKNLKTTVLGPDPNGQWEMWYEVDKEAKLYSGGGQGDRDGPKLTPNSEVRLRSKETVPLEIKIQWR